MQTITKILARIQASFIFFRSDNNFFEVRIALITIFLQQSTNFSVILTKHIFFHFLIPFPKTMFSKFCLILIFALNNYILCEETNILNKIITNPVLLSDRINRVLFVLSPNSSEAIFVKLVKSFLTLEEQTQNKFGGIRYNIFTNFGMKITFNFTKAENLNNSYGRSWCSKDDRVIN